MPYAPNPEARGVSHKTGREGFNQFSVEQGGQRYFELGKPLLSLSRP
jgi:hypothetical protein